MPQIQRILPSRIRRSSRIRRKETFGFAVVVEDEGQYQRSNRDVRDVIVLRDAELLYSTVSRSNGRFQRDLLGRHLG
jgi:hypothetical protein